MRHDKGLKHFERQWLQTEQLITFAKKNQSEKVNKLDVEVNKSV